MSLIWSNVAVLLKIVPDPEGIFEIDSVDGTPGKSLPRVPSIFDENAVEAAVQIKEATNCKVTVVCVGAASAEPLLKRALAMGADEAVLIEEDIGWDSLAAARLLAAALGQLGGFDLVLCGREAADTGSGLVGPYVAQALNMSFLTLVTAIRLEGEKIIAHRDCEGGYDVFGCRPPVLLTVSAEANRPRNPSVLKVLQVKKIPVRRLHVDVAASPILPGPASANIRSRSIPSATGRCIFIRAASAGETAAGLLAALREEKIL